MHSVIFNISESFVFFLIIYCQVQRTKYVEYLLFRISQVWETATCSSKLDETQGLEVQTFTCLIRQEILLHHVTDQIISVSLLPQSITLSFLLFLLIPSSVFAGIRWTASMNEWTQTETLARPSAWPRTPFLTVTTEILARRTWDCLERCRRTMTTNPKRNRSQNLKFIKWIHALKFHVSAFPFSSSCTGGYFSPVMPHKKRLHSFSGPTDWRDLLTNSTAGVEHHWWTAITELTVWLSGLSSYIRVAASGLCNGR